MAEPTHVLSDQNFKQRAKYGSFYTVLGFGGANLIRLASNLILTRLLFPEAFGLMAIVEIFMMGLKSMSDFGLNTAIIQSKRGDDPNFLNSAWVMQILRGFLLWGCMCALAIPASLLYSEDLLSQLLPVVGLNAVIQGFLTTNIASQNKHLILRKLTTLDILVQLLGVAITIVLVYYNRSVWSLVYGGLISSLIRVLILNKFLPGIKNRLVWEPASIVELFSFGKFIFISTLAGFLLNYGDRAVLAKYITLSDLANYNIAFFLASVPWLLNLMVVNKVLFPLYSKFDSNDPHRTLDTIRRLRFAMTGATISFQIFLFWVGEYLIRFLYDDRYHGAGPILSAMSLALVLQSIVSIYGSTFLARGDSKSFSVVMIAVALIKTSLLILLVPNLGLIGVFIVFFFWHTNKLSRYCFLRTQTRYIGPDA